MFAMLPFILVLFIVVALVLFRNVFGKLSAKTHWLVLLVYVFVLVTVASYFVLSINPNFKAAEGLTSKELKDWQSDELTYDMIEYDENDRVLVKRFPNELLKEKETVKVSNNQLKIDTMNSVSGLSEWELVIVIEEDNSLNDEVVYERYESPTILDYEGEYYDITDEMQKINVIKMMNGLTIDRENRNKILQINSLSSSLLLKQFKRDDKDWWHAVNYYEYGTSYGPTVLRIVIPKGLELEVVPELKGFIVEK